MSQNRNEFKQYTKSHIKKSGLFWLAVMLLLAGSVAYLPTIATMNIRESSKEKKLPIYSVGTQEKKVAISFDAAWGNDDLTKILAILKKHKVKATFFMTGGWVESYPEDVKTILAAGHDLANHSENHKQMSQLTKEECKKELMKVHKKVKELTGEDMILFRPPYGDYNNTLLEAAEESNYYTIQWDVDSLDWKDYGADAIVEKVCTHKNLSNGSIILMHNGAKYTQEALESVILGLQEKEYEIVPISELIIKDNYHIDFNGRQMAD